MSFSDALDTLADRSPLVALASALGLASVVCLGCTPAIGDKCAVSSDCSIQGNRTCDTSQTNGYCTVFGCIANSCPDNAACVVFGASVPSCPYDDYGAPSRVGRSMCLKTCGADSDCRQGDGYVCAQLTQPPWPAGPPWTAVLDDDQFRGVCIAAQSSTNSAVADAAVCSASRPMVPRLDAMVTVADAVTDVGDVGTPDSETGADVSLDVGDVGAQEESSVDAGEGEAGADAVSDVRSDGSQDATAEAGAVDAPSGA